MRGIRGRVPAETEKKQIRIQKLEFLGKRTNAEGTYSSIKGKYAFDRLINEERQRIRHFQEQTILRRIRGTKKII